MRKTSKGENNYIDYDFLSRDLEFCRGFAETISKTENPDIYKQYDNYAFSATYFRRAAEHSLLLSIIDNEGSSTDNSSSKGDRIDEAYTLLKRAAEQYKKWGSPYAILLAMISKNRRDLDDLTEYFTDYSDKNWDTHIFIRPIKVVQYIYALIGNGIYKSDFTKKIYDHLKLLPQYKTGILELSVQQILNVLEAIEDGPSEKLTKATSVVLINYDEILHLATQNKYRFERLAMNFHPATTEILGLLLKISQLRNKYVNEIISESAISTLGKEVLTEITANLEDRDRGIFAYA